MILKAKERGNAPQLAGYLLSMRDNEHVDLYDVRGFISDDLRGAFSEADAIAQPNCALCRKRHLRLRCPRRPARRNAAMRSPRYAISKSSWPSARPAFRRFAAGPVASRIYCPKAAIKAAMTAA